MGVGDFDVVAKDAVVADFESADRRFAGEGGLVIGEPLLAIGGNLTEAVQFGVESGGDDVAFTQMGGGVGADGGEKEVSLVATERFLLQEVGGDGGDAIHGAEFCEKFGGGGEAASEGGQIARGAPPYRDAGDDAFDVAEVIEGC